MEEELMAEVMQQMQSYLDNTELKQLRQVMEHTRFFIMMFLVIQRKRKRMTAML